MNAKKLEEVIFLVFVEFLILFIFRALLPPSESELYLTAKTALYIFDIAFVVFMVKVIDREKIAMIGLTFQNIFTQIYKGIIIYLVLLVVYVLPYYLLFGLGGSSKIVLNSLIVNTIINICIVALAEEMLFRGLILERLKQLLGSDLKAIVICSFIFGISQYPITHDARLILMFTYFGIVLSIFKQKFNAKIFSLALAHGLVFSTFNIFSHFLG